MNRRARRRRLGYGLLAFGLSGIVLIAAAAALVFGSLSAVDDAASGFDRQRVEILAMLGPASSALSNAATSASNAGTSLTESSAAAVQAAVLTSRMADSFDDLAELGTFEVFGTRPFGPLADQFGDVAAESRALSDDLTAAGTSLATNVADSEAVAGDLRALATQLDALETSLATADDGGLGSASGALGVARLVLVGLLVWLAIPAVVTTWLGWRLLRAAPARSG
jgi:hypothetical protein